MAAMPIAPSVPSSQGGQLQGLQDINDPGRDGSHSLIQCAAPKVGFC